MTTPDNETIDRVAAAMGLPSEVADMAKNIFAHGRECHRCHELVSGEGLYYMFAFTASSPCMETDSPPIIVCSDCGYRAAAFMGVGPAQQKVATMGPDPVG